MFMWPSDHINYVCITTWNTIFTWTRLFYYKNNPIQVWPILTADKISLKMHEITKLCFRQLLKFFLTTRGGKQQNVCKCKHLSLTIFISVNLLSLMYSDVEFFQSNWIFFHIKFFMSTLQKLFLQIFYSNCWSLLRKNNLVDHLL